MNTSLPGVLEIIHPVVTLGVPPSPAGRAAWSGAAILGHSHAVGAHLAAGRG